MPSCIRPMSKSSSWTGPSRLGRHRGLVRTRSALLRGLAGLAWRRGLPSAALPRGEKATDAGRRWKDSAWPDMPADTSRGGERRGASGGLRERGAVLSGAATGSGLEGRWALNASGGNGPIGRGRLGGLNGPVETRVGNRDMRGLPLRGRS